MKTCNKRWGKKGVIVHMKVNHRFNNFTGRDSFDGGRAWKLPKFGSFFARSSTELQDQAVKLDPAAERAGHLLQSSSAISIS